MNEVTGIPHAFRYCHLTTPYQNKIADKTRNEHSNCIKYIRRTKRREWLFQKLRREQMSKEVIFVWISIQEAQLFDEVKLDIGLWADHLDLESSVRISVGERSNLWKFLNRAIDKFQYSKRRKKHIKNSNRSQPVCRFHLKRIFDICSIGGTDKAQKRRLSRSN